MATASVCGRLIVPFGKGKEVSLFSCPDYKMIEEDDAQSR